MENKDDGKIARYTPQELQDYEDSLKVYRDFKNVIDTAELKGLKKGITNIAYKMKQGGVPIEQIIEYTGLTEEEITRL